MRNFIFLTVVFYLFTACKKDKHEAIPQDITGKWGLNSVSILGLIPTPLKSAKVSNFVSRDTLLEVSFLFNNKILYNELERIYYSESQTFETDSIYQSQGAFMINGNNLTINNIRPKYKPYFKKKEYMFEVTVSNKDTLLNIMYQDSVGKVPSLFTLGFSKMKS